MSKYFIGTYTNWCKEYCDERFFKRFGDIKGGYVAFVADNTDMSKNDYSEDLNSLYEKLGITPMCTTNTFKKENDHQFHHNVMGGVSWLRDHFLFCNAQYMLIIESDVIPPIDLLSRLDKTIATLPDDWGILGCLYYEGFHDYTKTGVHETHHALSGCTVYKRDVIERYPFRISAENWAAFPDAWICHDVKKEGLFRIFNDHDIRCEHLQYQGHSRQSKPL